MQTILIHGGTEEERLAKIKPLTEKVNREDLIIYEPENSIGIEEVRQLKHQISLKPYSSPYKICLIKNAETLTLPAQNALLKTLEEPPANTILILTTANPELILPTVLSRCQIISLAAKIKIDMDLQEAQNHLSTICDQLSSSTPGKLILASKSVQNRQELVEFIGKQTLLWREILLQKLNIISQYLNGQAANEHVDKLTIPQLLKILRRLQEAKKMIEGNVNSRLTMENFLLNLTS